MRKTLYILMVVAMATVVSGCDDWLREEAPGSTKLEDFFTDGTTALQSVNACYTPLGWEYQGTYYPEWFVGDVASDDAVKGGEYVLDMAAAYDIENFKTVASNELLLQFYRAQYQGISRCNFSLANVPNMPTDTIMTEPLKNRYIGEAKFLRAYYYFRLVRMFGGVPKVDFVIDSSNQWKQPRATAEDIYALILDDLEEAESGLMLRSEMTPEELGRATKGAAQAMLMKVNLYLGNYDAAKLWGEKIITSGEYDLNADYATNFLLEGENGIESVFEIQYTNDPTGDYGGGGTRGAFTARQQRCRSNKYTSGNAGWGYNRPSQSLYNEYEAGDPRRDLTIDVLTEAECDNPQVDFYEGVVKTVSLKYAMMTDGANGGVYSLDANNNPRDPINTKEIRYSDVLLMYAEACVENNNLSTAKMLLEKVRARARGENADILPAFPNYNGYTDTQDDLRKAIRHERRVELAMEGHRWFDLNRWGIAAEVMNAFGASEEVQSIYKDEWNGFRKGVHEIFPIPAEERRLAGLDQNYGY